MMEEEAPQGPGERQNYVPRHLWEMKLGDLTTDQKHMAREELWASSPGRCYVCPVPIRRDELHVAVDIDHLIPKGEQGRNHLPTMRLAHHACNARRGRPQQPIASPVPKRESEGGASAWTSEEGRRSDRMTYRYRQRLYHPKTGLFRNPGQIFPRKWLADVLPDLCEVGKSTTYHKYIDEDIAAEYLEEKEIDGVTKLERTLKPYPEKKMRMEE